MKTTRQRRKTTGESSPQINATMGISSTIAKAPITKMGVRRRKATGKSFSNSAEKDFHPFSSHTAQVLSEKLPVKRSATPETIKIAPTSVMDRRHELQSSAKTKMQLFPIDEVTRKGLEKDGFNPYLELIVSDRKKMSSVFKHLKSKWGSSCVAMGDLVIFPYDIQLENLASHIRWTVDTDTSTADVYVAIGRPSVFRLRYGWFSNREPINSCVPPTSCFENCLQHENTKKSFNVNAKIADSETQPFKVVSEGFRTISCSDIQGPVVDSPMPSDRADELQICSTMGDELTLSSFWASNLNVSIGGLFREASLHAAASRDDPTPKGTGRGLQPNSFCCDSFDAAIAAFKFGCPQGPGNGSKSSIFDVEETRQPFSSQRFPNSDVEGDLSASKDAPFSSLNQNIDSMPCKVPNEAITQAGITQNYVSQEPKVDSLLQIQGVGNNNGSNLGMANSNWLAKQASELHAQYRPPVQASTTAAPAIPTVTTPQTFVLGNCYECDKPEHQKRDCPTFSRKVGLVVDDMRESVIATVQHVLQDEDEEETGMCATYMRESSGIPPS
ncbi:hypothetical protein GIB67_014546 [Kingdonia uniflora]|uniref:CCHC-type domain-containing protein n=1 Tax=Kingdonia uniflora TaxID=39325 RepID=A0A7J7LK91_9MAGN|nr:hypothetical protein GIB67_014546 [Kingdonia uniflora]